MEDKTQWLSVTVAKYLLIKIVQSTSFICQSHAANNQAPGVQSSLPWQGDGKLIYAIQLPTTMSCPLMCNNSYHLNNNPHCLVPKQGIDKRFTVVMLFTF